MKQLSLLLLFSIGSFVINAQNTSCNYSVSGQVLDAETKAPIPYATVEISKTKYTLTDEEGNFTIDSLCSEDNVLIISCLGYSSATKDHHHEHDNTTSHFYLTQQVTGLEEVTIQAKQHKEKGVESISQVVMKSAEITSNPTQSLGEALSDIEGVTFNSNGTNVKLPVIHGLSGNRILILNNGIKHGFQNWGTDHAPEIDISSASSITVVKGAAGVRYGPEALGGVILIKPNSLLLNNPFSVGLGTSYETNGRGYSTNLKIEQGTKNWSYFANGNYIKIGDRFAPDYSLTNTGKEEKAFGLGVLRHLNKWDFKINYSYVNQNLGLLRSSVTNSSTSFIRAIDGDEPVIIEPFSYDINAPNQNTQHHLLKAEANWYYAENAKLTFVGGAQLNKRLEFDVRRATNNPIIDLDLITHDYQLDWQHPKWKGLEGIIGVQYFNQNSDNNPGTDTTPFIPNYNTERFSAFVVESLSYGKNTFEGGFRLDYESNDVRGRETNQDIFRDEYNFSNFTSSLGYVRQLSKNSTFRTNLGTAWRIPNMEELFSFGQQGFKTNFGLLRYVSVNGELNTNEVISLEDSGVEPEKGYKFINEFQTNNDGNAHSLTVYSHYIENYIFDRPIGVFGTIRGPMPAYIFDQADALFFGSDYTWKKKLTNSLTSTYGLSLLWSKNINENSSLINEPPISTDLELRWDQKEFWVFDYSKWTIKPSYTFKQFQAPRTVTVQSLIDESEIVTTDSEIFDFADAPDGYFLLDLSWSFKWRKLNGSISANNILNNSYRNYLNEFRYFADEPGRNIIFAFNYKF